jgi:hypothetical protein
MAATARVRVYCKSITKQRHGGDGFTYGVTLEPAHGNGYTAAASAPRARHEEAAPPQAFAHGSFTLQVDANVADTFAPGRTYWLDVQAAD